MLTKVCQKKTDKIIQILEIYGVFKIAFENKEETNNTIFCLQYNYLLNGKS